ncbi:biotin/lipoyl-containing protein [Oricola indica]|uniref:biotin/lipoyl-containing protein n=1 Tax=Oricola indica TaxID=2872591 RepID=UPI003CCB7462
MPHEVIMPALGMAQETGLILAWRKAPGDAVKIGDVLMEVETDKAAMEVEAQAEGYLADIRAREGENVPVGNVIAVIADEPGAVAAGEEATPADAPSDEQPPAQQDGNEVIMPALGMAQDTGLLVAWHKQPGDAVAADDVLLEVETDKSVMEVQAGHDGYVAELRAEAGENVPVGDVIAVISAEKPEVPVKRNTSKKKDAKPEQQVTSASPKNPETSRPAPKRAASQPPTGDRILASPKAKRLAAERGLDLARLATDGHRQPYHVADLDRLSAVPAQPSTATANAFDHVEARVDRSGYDAFRLWLAGESQIDDLAVWSAFAIATLRAAIQSESRRMVAQAHRPLRRQSVRFCDPDLSGLSAIEASQDDPAPDLILRDLTGSAVTKAHFGAPAVPAISISDSNGTFEITLESPAGMLEPETALAIVHEMAVRLEEPLRHLL